MTINIETFRFSEFGDPSVLAFKAETLGGPGPGEIQIRHLAIGMNYIDIYHRRGSAPLPLPSGIGVEGVGVITALGDGVPGFSIGQRIAYVGGPPGAYATHRNLPASRALALPEELETREVAALVF